MQFLPLLSLFFIGKCSAQTQFDATGQAGILNAHNNMRSSIAKGTYVVQGSTKPAGANIYKLKWNATLAYSAQNWANQCKVNYSATPGVGENIIAYFTTDLIGDLNPYGSMASASWERKFETYGWPSNVFNMTSIATATLMAWANTYSIGCGVKNCGKTYNGSNWVMVTCQYYPRGNYIMQNIYNTGLTCSQCPSGSTCETATGLCVKP